MTRKNNSGFTLVEIMIIVVILSLLALLSVPMLARNRVTAQRNACMNNLRQLNSHFQQYMLMNGTTTVPSLSDIASAFPNSALPTCPGSGTYTPPVTEDDLPTCSLGISHGHRMDRVGSRRARHREAPDWPTGSA